MICSSCGTENKPDSAFCMGCGSPLGEVPFSSLEKDTKSPGATRPASGSPSEPAEGSAAPASWAWEGEKGEQRGEGDESLRAERGMRQEPTLVVPVDAGMAPAAASRDETATLAQSTRITSPSGFVFAAPAASPPADGQETPAPMGAPTFDLPGEAPPPADQPGVHHVVEEIRGEERPRPEPDYYVPPEADYQAEAARPEPPARQEPPVTAAAPATSLDSTQSIAPVSSGAAAVVSRPRVICPECYAPNSEQNMYCQECGSALPTTKARQAAASRGQARPAGYQQTAVIPADMSQAAAMQPGYAAAEQSGDKARTAKSLGVADVMAVLSIGAIVMALVPAFTWKKGIETGVFSHQGAFTQGRTDLLGGPGLLPYSGMEFFTVGLVAAVGAGLALIFLAVRAGRGPMYTLAGSILLFPPAYLIFQAVLPLRQMGISVQPALGLEGVFLGNAGNPGLGPPLWLIAGAGVLLVLAGFLAPPRGWGRLFTFLLFSSLAIGAAFFCAVCYNWNIFISDTALASHGAGLYTSAIPSILSVIMH